MKITPIIGLEIHVQLKTNTKMFCACSSQYHGQNPNTHMCPTCLALPGALPVVNEQALVKAIQTGVVLNCNINAFSKFERKNYFYPDLFKGYQITQYEKPICTDGYIDIFDGEKFEKRIGIFRAHLEEDTAKSLHEYGRSLVDGNKAGVPLLEIVSKPDMNSAEEAEKFAKIIYENIRFSHISDCDMEKGQMRFDINVNLLIEKDNDKFATPIVEVKNLNSFRALVRAVNYEIERQEEDFNKTAEVLTAGNKTTRGWNDLKGVTTFQRSKEEANDYRYLPEPDIPPLDLSNDFIENAKHAMGETILQAKEVLKQKYGLPEKDTNVLLRSTELYNWFKQVCDKTKLSPTLVANWVISEVLSYVNADNKEVGDEDFNSQDFAHLMDLVNDKKLTNAQVKDVVKQIYSKKDSVDEIIKEKGFENIDDKDVILKVVEEVINENSEVVQTVLSGKDSAVQFLIGQVMKKTKGAVTPTVVNEILRTRLSHIDK